MPPFKNGIALIGKKQLKFYAASSLLLNTATRIAESLNPNQLNIT
jgi:hypothetical protein